MSRKKRAARRLASSQPAQSAAASIEIPPPPRPRSKRQAAQAALRAIHQKYGVFVKDEESDKKPPVHRPAKKVVTGAWKRDASGRKRKQFTKQSLALYTKDTELADELKALDPLDLTDLTRELARIKRAQNKRDRRKKQKAARNQSRCNTPTESKMETKAEEEEDNDGDIEMVNAF